MPNSEYRFPQALDPVLQELLAMNRFPGKGI